MRISDECFPAALAVSTLPGHNSIHQSCNTGHCLGISWEFHPTKNFWGKMRWRILSTRPGRQGITEKSVFYLMSFTTHPSHICYCWEEFCSPAQNYRSDTGTSTWEVSLSSQLIWGFVKGYWALNFNLSYMSPNRERNMTSRKASEPVRVQHKTGFLYTIVQEFGVNQMLNIKHWSSQRKTEHIKCARKPARISCWL